jgi:hypothetical protein
MPQSKVNARYEFSKTKWVVSLLNAGSPLGGHSFIVVEGLRTAASGEDELFVGKYEIFADMKDGYPELQNLKGYITEVKVREGNVYSTDPARYDAERIYGATSSRSSYVMPAAAQAMIDTIKADKARTDTVMAEFYDAHARGDTTPFLTMPHITSRLMPYQSAGSKRICARDEGHNCTTWAEEKLAICDLAPGNHVLDSIKAMPETHAGGRCAIL